MPKEELQPIRFIEGENRKSAWVRELRTTLREHRGVIKTAISLSNQAVEQYNPDRVKFGVLDVEYDKKEAKWFGVKNGILDRSPRQIMVRGTMLAPGKPIMDEPSGLEVTLLGRSNREIRGWHHTRIDKCDYLKFTLDSKSFFVKRSFVTINPGFVEFHNTLFAKELLKDLDFVRVINAELGYQDQNESWFVSKWEDLEEAGYAPYRTTVNDYGKITRISEEVEGSYGGFESKKEYLNVQKKVKLIEEKLKTLSMDLDMEANLFYNHQTKTFILLDITSKYSETLGEAIKDD